MRAAMPLLLLGLAACVAPTVRGTDVADGCRMEPADRAWLTRARAVWPIVQRELLKVDAEEPPELIVFDVRCRYVFRGGREIADAHGGEVVVPSGKRIPAKPTAFAHPAQKGDGGFFVISLPSVFRAAGITSGAGLDALVEAAFLHELTHTRQFYFANPMFRALTAQYGLPDDLDDDSLQALFEKNEAYTKAWKAERDLLFAAAAAADDASARKLAGEALRSILQRRETWFKGEHEQWIPLDELFLTMEGIGQWAAYAWWRDPRGRKLDAATALREIRREGRWWSQDEGLAIFLVVDRLVPGWQRLAFARKPETASSLLELAAREPR